MDETNRAALQRIFKEEYDRAQEKFSKCNVCRKPLNGQQKIASDKDGLYHEDCASKKKHGVGYWMFIVGMVAFWILILSTKERNGPNSWDEDYDEWKEREAEMSEWDFHSNR